MTQSPPELRLLYPRSSLSSASGDGLSNIIVDELPDGALCVVIGEGIYQLDKLSSETVSSPTILPTARGAGALGRWLQFASGITPPSDGSLIVNPGDPAAYQTIQAALDAGAASASGPIVVDVRAGTYPENLVVAPGRYVTIRFANENFYGNVIAGTVTWNSVGGDALTFVNCEITGNISGAGTGNRDLVFVKCGVDGNVTLTGGSARLFANGQGGDYDVFQGYFDNPVSVSGRISLTGTGVYDTLAGTTIQLTNCALNTTGTVTSSDAYIQLIGTSVDLATSFVFVGAAGAVYADGHSLSRILLNSATVTNGVVRGELGGLSVKALSQTNNIAATDVIPNPVTGLYRIDLALIVKTVGTTGTIQPNVIFTDALGTPTVAVGTGLNITGTGRVQGSYTFRAAGPGNIQFSVTGVVTPGTLDYDFEAVVTNLGD